MKKSAIISLSEAIDIASSGSIDDIDPRLSDFMTSLDEVATDILREKDRDYLFGAVSLIQSLTVALLVDQNIVSMEEVIDMMTNPKFQFIVGIIFKLSVGLAANEELH